MLRNNADARQCSYFELGLRSVVCVNEQHSGRALLSVFHSHGHASGFQLETPCTAQQTTPQGKKTGGVAFN